MSGRVMNDTVSKIWGRIRIGQFILPFMLVKRYIMQRQNNMYSLHMLAIRLTSHISG